MASHNPSCICIIFFILLLHHLPCGLSSESTPIPDSSPETKIITQTETETEPETIPSSLIERHEALLRRLESVVSALESHPLIRNSKPKQKSKPETETETENPKPNPAKRSIAVTKQRPLFTERFLFSAAAILPSGPATSAFPLPFEDQDSVTRYFAVGDSSGMVYIFSCTGDVILQLPSFSNSSVTALLSYLSPRRGECFLFVGHSDGSIGAHRLSESASSPDSDWLSLSPVGTHWLITRGLDNSPVTILEFYQIARARYIIAGDSAGRIRVFTENGTLYGTAIMSSKPVAYMKQRLLFLTETGAASLELRSMVVRETECEGLNGSVAKVYSFDQSERLKAYGLTREGDLVHLVILGDVSNLKCRLRAIRRTEIDAPVSIQTIKGGYLLVASKDRIFVYNISSQYYGRVGAPRPLFFTSIKEIKSLFLNSDLGEFEPGDGEFTEGNPLIVADREKLVILGFGDGYIGIYRSNFPTFRPESNSVVWTGPALLFLLFLIVIWQFYVKKKDSLGWAPEESFNTSSVMGPTSSLLNNSNNERSGFADTRTATSNTTAGLRGAPRRYLSPTRYAGVSPGISYRPVSGEPGLKYRGQVAEHSSFVNQRDPFNTQVVDDHTD